jgi:hypothetical protein
MLSLGVSHSAVILRNGKLYTGGSKVDGQLSLPYDSQNGINSLTQYKDTNDLNKISVPLHEVKEFSVNNKAI